MATAILSKFSKACGPSVYSGSFVVISAPTMNSKQRRLVKRLLKEIESPLPTQLSQPLVQTEPKSLWRAYAKWFYSGLTFLIAAVALIELFPRPGAAAYPPSDENNVLNSRFTVSNDGYLKLVDLKSGCFIWKTNFPYVKNVLFFNNSPSKQDVDNDFLPSDVITVPCTDPRFSGVTNIKSADIAIVISYRPWPFIFIKRRRLFRFVSRKLGSITIWDRESIPREFESDLESTVTFFSSATRGKTGF